MGTYTDMVIKYQVIYEIIIWLSFHDNNYNYSNYKLPVPPTYFDDMFQDHLIILDKAN